MMKKKNVSTTKIVFFLLGSLLIAVSPLAGANAAGPNLVFNPGFETAGASATDADGWELFAQGGGTAEVAERQTVMPHSGLAHVLLEGDPAELSNFAVIVQRELPVTADTDYAMSFFAQASEVDGEVGYRLEFYDDTDTLIGGVFDLNVFIDSGLTSSYQQFSSIFTAPPTAATGAMVMFYQLLNAPTSVNWDDVYFGAVSADFDADSDVDGTDFLSWQRGFGATTGMPPAVGDADSDGAVSGGDLTVWEQQYGTVPPTLSAVNAVPEPSTLLLGGAALITLLRRRPRT